jgi:hypothetical protein
MKSTDNYAILKLLYCSARNYKRLRDRIISDVDLLAFGDSLIDLHLVDLHSLIVIHNIGSFGTQTAIRIIMVRPIYRYM